MSTTGGTVDDNVIIFTSAGATATFGRAANATITDKVNYFLATDIYNGALSNTIKFENANVTLGQKDYNVGNTSYVLDNSLLTLIDSSLDNYNFTALKSQNNTAEIALDVNFHNLTSDTLTLGGESSGVITISNFNVLDIDQNDKGIIQVIKAQNNNIRLAISDKLAYEFGIIGNTLNNKAHVIKNDDGTDSIRLNSYDYVGLKALRLATITTQDDSVELYNSGR